MWGAKTPFYNMIYRSGYIYIYIYTHTYGDTFELNLHSF